MHVSGVKVRGMTNNARSPTQNPRPPLWPGKLKVQSYTKARYMYVCMYSDSEAAAWNLAKCHPRDKRNWPKMQRLAEPEPSQ